MGCRERATLGELTDLKASSRDQRLARSMRSGSNVGGPMGREYDIGMELEQGKAWTELTISHCESLFRTSICSLVQTCTCSPQGMSILSGLAGRREASHYLHNLQKSMREAERKRARGMRERVEGKRRERHMKRN